MQRFDNSTLRRNKKRLHFRKTGMKAFDEFRPAHAERTGPILLFAEKCPETFGADERNPTGILTAASCLFPPSRPGAVALGIVAVTVAQPSRNLTGFPDIGLR